MGKIVQIYAAMNEVETVFLRRVKSKTPNTDSLTFICPDMEDKSSHDVDDIILGLPKPNTTGGTRHCKEKFVFSCPELYGLSIE